MTADLPEEPIDVVDLDDEEVLVLDEVQAEPELPMWEATGEPRVDAALDLLGSLDDDVHAHAAVFDEIHRQLHATLSDVDSASA